MFPTPQVPWQSVVLTDAPIWSNSSNTSNLHSLRHVSRYTCSSPGYYDPYVLFVVEKFGRFQAEVILGPNVSNYQQRVSTWLTIKISPLPQKFKQLITKT